MKSKQENNILLYQDENGITNVSVRLSNEDVWLTQSQIVEIYDTTQPNISMDIDSILKDGRLPVEATHKKFLLVQTEGKREMRQLESDFDRAVKDLAKRNKGVTANSAKEKDSPNAKD